MKVSHFFYTFCFLYFLSLSQALQAARFSDEIVGHSIRQAINGDNSDFSEAGLKMPKMRI